MSDGWASAVAAARKQGKSLWFCEHMGGGTIECCTSKEAALKYRAEQNRPHLYKVFEQTPLGILYEVT
jgi:hypothetical protein